MKIKVLLLGTDCDSTWIVANYLNEFYNLENIIVEKNVSKIKLIKNRIKKLGFIKVFGQLLFQVLVYPLIKPLSQKRIIEICNENNLNNNAALLFEKTTLVESVNDSNTIDLIKNFSVDIIVINGTRILSKNFLKNFESPIINTHVGITPKYRGVHGAYWALANNDKENCGVTVHLVDSGIDTGGVINQIIIFPNNHDNIVTYPYLQIAAALPMLKEAVESPKPLKENSIKESFLWYHPTLYDYIKNIITLGVK